MSDPEYTTISLRKTTVQRLQKLRRYGLSWDDIINEMADQFDPDEISFPPEPNK